MKRILFIMALAVIMLMVSCHDGSSEAETHVHEWDEGTPVDSTATILTKGRLKYTCAKCNETKEGVDYCPVTGYWKSSEISLSSAKLTYYFSLDNTSDAVVDCFTAEDGKTYTSGFSMGSRYSWETDDTGKRTLFKIRMSVNGASAEIPYVPSVSGESGKTVLTLKPQGEYQDKMEELILTRQSDERHSHTGTAQKLEVKDGGHVYHSLTLSCREGSHPSVGKIKETHIYSNTDEEKKEFCSSCSRERTYALYVCWENAPDQPSIEYVTKKNGFTLGQEYTSKSDGVTRSNLTWYFKDGSAIPEDGVIHPDKDGIVIWYREQRVEPEPEQ